MSPKGEKAPPAFEATTTLMRDSVMKFSSLEVAQSASAMAHIGILHCIGSLLAKAAVMALDRGEWRRHLRDLTHLTQM